MTAGTDPEAQSMPSPPSTQDARDVLLSDRARIDALFAEDARLQAGGGSAADRAALLSRVGGSLRVLFKIKEEVLYPALQAPPQALREAAADMARMRAQLEALAAMPAAGPAFDSQLQALAEALRAHLAFEEKELLPHLQGLDAAALGSRLALRRAELLDEGQD